MSLAQEGAKVMGGRVKLDSLSKATVRPLVQKEETGAFRWLR